MCILIPLYAFCTVVAIFGVQEKRGKNLLAIAEQFLMMNLFLMTWTYDHFTSIFSADAIMVEETIHHLDTK